MSTLVLTERNALSQTAILTWCPIAGCSSMQSAYIECNDEQIAKSEKIKDAGEIMLIIKNIEPVLGGSVTGARLHRTKSFSF